MKNEGSVNILTGNNKDGGVKGETKFKQSWFLY